MKHFLQHMGGESRNDVRKRIYKACQDIMEEENEIVLVVSHGGACSHFLGQIISDEDYQEIRKQGFKNCSIFKYSYEDGRFTFEEVIRPLPIE